jgi:hypothetical protein
VISLQVGDCWLWSLIIFLIHRSLFSAMFIPHEDCTPLHAGGGFAPPVGVWGRSPRRKIFLVNVYCNFIVNWTVHYKVADLMVEVMLGFFSLSLIGPHLWV